MENQFKGTKAELYLSKVNGELITTEDTNICKVFALETKEGQANAKLIASAPEMLEALIKINDIVFANVIVAGSDEYFQIRELCNSLIKKATE